MKLIYENGVPCGVNWELKGEIKNGDNLVWEPLDDDVKCYVTVTSIQRVDGENFYELTGEDGSISVNCESSVRESCVRNFRNVTMIPADHIFGD